MKIDDMFTNDIKSQFKIRISPAGLHLFNRNTGVNILIDEIKPPSNKWSTAPRHVSIAITNACDLTCSHCYAPKNPAMLPFDNLIKWLSDLDTNGCIGVGFGGGEPTLYPYLSELCSYATKKTNLAVTMTTHAQRLNDEFLNQLIGNLHFIRVSMDGIGHTYESIRNRPFDKLIDNIAKIQSIFPFGINYVVNSKTIKDLDAAVQLAEDLGASEFLLLPEEPVGRAVGIDSKTRHFFQKWVNEHRGSIPLTVSEGGAEGLPICNPLKAEKSLAAFAHIDASGNIKKTSYGKNGVPIEKEGVMEALEKLRIREQELIK